MAEVDHGLVLKGFIKAQALCRVEVRACCVNGDTKDVQMMT